MAEAAQRAFEPQAKRSEPSLARSGTHHEALQRRGDVREAGHRALLNARPAGPQPMQPAAAANRTGLPDRLKAGVEALSGLSMDDVKVHYGSAEPARLQAHAFARGSHIHLAPGQERHLPHEAWHVVQQAKGRVKATMQMAGGIMVNDDAALEHEADVMGARALTAKSLDRVLPLARGDSRGTIQANGLGKMFSFLKNLFGPKVPFPKLGAGSGKNQFAPFQKYKQKHNFAGYDIAGDFNAVPDGTSEIDIRYMERTPASTGFKNLFSEGEAAAREVGSNGITITFDQCKPQVLERLNKHAPAAGFNLIQEIPDPDVNGPGPTRIYSKTGLTPKKE